MSTLLVASEPHQTSPHAPLQVLPPGEFNDIILHPLPLYSGSSSMKCFPVLSQLTVVTNVTNLSENNLERRLSLRRGWLVFNGTFITKGYHAMRKVKFVKDINFI